MTNYATVSAIAFLILGLMWKRDRWANFVFKVALLGLGGWGLLLALQAMGYVVRAA